MERAPALNRIGVAKGLFEVPDSIDLRSAEVAPYSPHIVHCWRAMRAQRLMIARPLRYSPSGKQMVCGWSGAAAMRSRM